jgi:hypothetical protein
MSMTTRASTALSLVVLSLRMMLLTRNHHEIWGRCERNSPMNVTKSWVNLPFDNKFHTRNKMGLKQDSAVFLVSKRGSNDRKQ